MSGAFTLAKGAVRRSFDGAADTYDDAAVLAREVADRMLERLDLIKAVPQRLLELGSGTGYGGEVSRSPGSSTPLMPSLSSPSVPSSKMVAMPSLAKSWLVPSRS